MNWGNFFAMGGYATYVWASYGVAAIVLIFNVVGARSRVRNVKKSLEAFYQVRKQSK